MRSLGQVSHEFHQEEMTVVRVIYKLFGPLRWIGAQSDLHRGGICTGGKRRSEGDGVRCYDSEVEKAMHSVSYSPQACAVHRKKARGHGISLLRGGAA